MREVYYFKYASQCMVSFALGCVCLLCKHVSQDGGRDKDSREKERKKKMVGVVRRIRDQQWSGDKETKRKRHKSLRAKFRETDFVKAEKL